MKVLAVLLSLGVASHAGIIAPTTLVRTPSLDSAIIKSDRLGGNFAYSSVEGHAYAAVSPVIQNVISPVGVSYTATPVATPIAYPQYYAPGAFFTSGSPAIISPVSPGIIAPGFAPPTIVQPAGQFVIPGLTPIEVPKEGEAPIQPAEGQVQPAPEAPVVEPAAPAPELPAEAPLADDDDEVSIVSA